MASRLKVKDVFKKAKFPLNEWFKLDYGQSRTSITNSYEQEVLAYGYGWLHGIVVYKNTQDQIRAMGFGAMFPMINCRGSTYTRGKGVTFISIPHAIDLIQNGTLFAQKKLYPEALLKYYIGEIIISADNYKWHRYVHKLKGKGYGFSDHKGRRYSLKTMGRYYLEKMRGITNHNRFKFIDVPKDCKEDIIKMASILALVEEEK